MNMFLLVFPQFCRKKFICEKICLFYVMDVLVFNLCMNTSTCSMLLWYIFEACAYSEKTTKIICSIEYDAKSLFLPKNIAFVFTFTYAKPHHQMTDVIDTDVNDITF